MRYTLYGGSASLCAGCANIVDKVFHSVIDNVLYNCGFSNSDGRWSTSRESQIARCYAAAHPGGRLSKIEEFYEIKAQMAEKVRVCKLTHQRRDCVSCNESESSAAVQQIHKSGNPLRDSLRQLPSRPKLNDVNVVDPCQPGTRGATFPCKQPTSKVIEPGMLEGGNDLLRQGPGATGNPGGGAGPPVASPLYNRSR
jgi:hypothetical protein